MIVSKILLLGQFIKILLKGNLHDKSRPSKLQKTVTKKLVSLLKHSHYNKRFLEKIKSNKHETRSYFNIEHQKIGMINDVIIEKGDVKPLYVMACLSRECLVHLCSLIKRLLFFFFGNPIDFPKISEIKCDLY